MPRTSLYRSWGIGALALLFTLVASAAPAATVSYDAAFGFGLAPGSENLNLPQWDPALFPGQVLVGVQLEIDATVGANVTAENDSANAGNMGVNLNGSVSATSGSLSPVAIINQIVPPVAVAATDGNAGSGPDFHDFGAISGNDSDSESIAAGLAAYIGAGNILAAVNGNGGFSVSGVSDSTIQVSDFAANGLVTITYEYVAVPEPASVVLGALGACGLALVGWRRRRSR